nr:adenosine deaminase [Hymenolepis microstoma]
MFNTQRKEVELHLHFDGAWRPETIFRFAQKKGMSLPCSNAEEFEKHLRVVESNSLRSFLTKFDCILPPIRGDKEALHQITVGFVEDCVNRGGHCYVEPRFCPFFFADDNLTVDEATETVLKSMATAAHRHNLQWRAILCMMRQNPEWSEKVVELALANRQNGVVAVDVAGDDKPCDGRNTDKRIKDAFQRAHDAGLHCIAHAGENGCAASVTEAVHEMHAERIGHGYHILNDKNVYKDMKERGVHFEVCPLSSHLTGSVVGNWQEHPIVKFERDGVNYSISTDDPTVTGQWLQAEKRMLAMNWLLDADQFQNANIRAAKACFLDDDDKRKLIQHLEEIYDNS